MPGEFHYKFIQPEAALADFVESIGMFHNPTDQPKEVVVMPDGRIDLFFMRQGTAPVQVLLIGLETEPEQRSLPPRTFTYSVSFRPLGAEYLLHSSIADLLNSAKTLPDGFWDIQESDLRDFDTFQQKISAKMKTLLPNENYDRKRTLFELIYKSRGEMSVKELSESVHWSSRQINRYFSQQLGLSLKAYCDILRFRASLEHIAQGKLFPELNFSDQSHFIKKIKKFSGVVPKELSKNENDRFVLLSVLKQQ